MKYLKTGFLALTFSSAILTAQNDSVKNTVSMYKERAFQFTFISPIGTNGLECYKTSNKVSLNLLAGVSRSVNGFEAGTIANVVLKDVHGAQFAGFANVVLGEVQGAQFSSYFNYTGKNLHGASLAGIGNVNMGELDGAQIASFFNFNRKGGKGLQLAGHSNLTLGNFNGSQISTLANIAIGDVKGAQISAGVNFAKKVKGIQLGFVNIADSVDGASIGFINLVKKGMHQIEFSADELFYTNLSFRTGTSAFYNIFSVGYQPGSKDNLWHFGYGAGTSLKINSKLRGDANVTAHHVNTNGFYWGTSELLRLYLGVEYRIAKKITLAAGPTYNFYMSDALLSKFNPTKKEIAPYNNFDRTTSNDFNIKGWVGGRIAIRFL